MPSLDLATSQPSFRNQIGILKIHNVGAFNCGKEKGFYSPSIQVLRKGNFNQRRLEIRCVLLMKAVSTLEHKFSVLTRDQHEDGHGFLLAPEPSRQDFQSSSEACNELDEREKLRRLRISKANKGNVPWNKGRKHSAETLQRIREKTKLAMQDPKVKLKLANLGHAQSEETRAKIGIGVRMGWQRRREKLMVQETCLLQWQNLIAEASRRGSSDEEEMQWDSYETLNKQLEREWLDNVEQRKSMSRPKGSKRAPKSVEQRRKISEAISAKWADPGYRERVCFALAKYHGSPTGVKKTPRRRPSGDAQSVKSNTKKSSEDSIISSIDKKNQQRHKLKKSISPTYKDPLADSKLEMIKNIRVQKMAMETKKIEAMKRAKLLIAEAEKAASALEVAALKSPLARASLMETRKLIAEATRSLEVAEVGQNMKFKHMSYEAEVENGESISDRKVNGTCVSLSSKKRVAFDFDQRAMQILLNESEHKQVSPPPQPANLINGMEDSRQLGADQVAARNKYRRAPFVNRENSRPPPTVNVEASSGTAANKVKKWVCGRLVEVAKPD